MKYKMHTIRFYAITHQQNNNNKIVHLKHKQN